MNIPVSSYTFEDKGLLRVLTSKCGISRAFDPRANTARPTIRNYTAIWDTGATSCAISARVVRELGLKPIGVQRVFTASSKEGVSVDAYMVNVLLPNGVGVCFVRTAEGEMNGADVIIGMDVISRGDFAITHKGGNTKFSFQMPSTHDIDFEKELQRNCAEASHTPITKEKKVGRNDPCPCGSGKKYKHCCGKNE